MKEVKIGKGQKLWKRAKQIMPGGSQLLSKRAEMFLPDGWPAYYKKAKGITIWDLDGNKYFDFSSMGIGACVLGYADPDVNKAVSKVIAEGSMATLNCPEEVELAEELIKINPWGGMVRFARTGGESMAIAVRIARAASGKDKVAFCGYHGWSDWYISTNIQSANNLDDLHIPGLLPSGVPKGLHGTALPFHYNKIEELEEILKDNEVGVIVMETVRHNMPENDFLKKVQNLARARKVILVLDEVSVGFRMRLGGAYSIWGIEPDIAVYAKALGNGYPIGAIVGRKEVMDAAQKTFISSTYWTERVGPAAALAVIKKFKSKKVPRYIDKIGKKILDGWAKAAQKHGLSIKLDGPNCLATFAFQYKNAQEIKTLFVQEMLACGYIAGTSVYVSYAHKEADLKKYFKVIDEVFGLIKKAIDSNSVSSSLRFPVAHTGFHRIT